MDLLTGFTSDPRQRLTFSTADGDPVTFTFVFSRQQKGWFYDVEFGEFSANGMRLALHRNALTAHRHLIPFGLTVLSNQKFEPQTIDALSNGSVSLYLLNADDLDEVQAIIDGV